MSHSNERSEKDCLNCGAVVQGPFCHICGQANVETKESLWGLVQHFVYDITHFDGKFFSSLKYLLFRPGFLSYEYMRGRRASYLNPVRMYVFTAALFFVVLFSRSDSANVFRLNSENNASARLRLNNALNTVSTQHERDSIVGRLAKLDTAQVLAEMYEFAEHDSSVSEERRNAIRSSLTDSEGRSLTPIGFGDVPATVEEYNRKQDSAGKKDGWFEAYLTKKLIKANKKYRGRKDEFTSDFGDKLLHSLPTMMFISMPVVAAFLMLLYMRRRNQFYFASHAILVIHVYIAIYIILMLMFGVEWLRNSLHLDILVFINILLGAYIVYYGFRSMRVFYDQGFGKTLLKFLLLGSFITVLMALLSVVFVVNTFINI